MTRLAALLGLVLVSCSATPAAPRQDASPTEPPEPKTGFQPLPSLHRIGSVAGRREVLAFRYGELARTVEVDGFGRVLLRDPTAGATFSAIVSASTGRPLETHLSHDGRWAVVQLGNDAIEIWNAESGTRTAELGHTGWLRAALAPSRPVAAVITNRSAKIVDLETGETAEVERRPYRAFIAPDGQHAVVGDILWSLSAEPRKVRELEGMRSPGMAHGFSHDSQHFAYTRVGGELQVVSTAEGSVELTVGGEDNEVGGDALHWSPNDAHILVEGAGTTIIEVSTGRLSSDPGTLAALSPSGDTAVFARRGEAVWQRFSDAEVLATITPADEYTSAVFIDENPLIADPEGKATVDGPRRQDVGLSPDLRQHTRFDARGVLVSGEGDGRFGRLEPHVRTPESDEPKLQPIDTVHAVDFEDDDTLVSYGATLTRWSIADGLRRGRSCGLSRLEAAREGSKGQVVTFAAGIATRNEYGYWLHSKREGCPAPEQHTSEFGIDDHDLAAVSPDATALLLGLRDLAVDLAGDASFEHGAEAVRDVAVDPAGDTIALREYDGVRISSPEGSHKLDTGPTSALAWDGRDGRLVVAGSRGLTLIADSAEPKIIQVADEDLDPDTVDIEHLVLAADTVAWQVESDGDERLVIASVESGRIIARIQGVHPFAVSPDGSLVAFAVPGWIRTLDVSSGREVSATRTQLREVERLRFSPSGSRLAVVGHGLEVYDVSESGDPPRPASHR